MNCGVNSILIASEKGDRGLTGATGPTGPTGQMGIGVQQSVKKMFFDWTYPTNGSTISISYTDFNSAIFSNQVYNKNTSQIESVDLSISDYGMLLSRLIIYVYVPNSAVYMDVTGMFYPHEIKYSSGAISISLTNPVSRINSAMAIGTSSVKFLIVLIG